MELGDPEEFHMPGAFLCTNSTYFQVFYPSETKMIDKDTDDDD